MRTVLSMRVFIASVTMATLAVVSAGAASASAGASPIPRCQSSQMRVTHGPVTSTILIEGRRVSTPIIFTNVGARCEIWGTPILQPVVGPTHKLASPPAFNRSIGQMPALHIVATGAAVSTIFIDTLYFSLATCSVTVADGLIVEIPTFVRQTYVALPMTVCAGMTATSTQLIVNGVLG